MQIGHCLGIMDDSEDDSQLLEIILNSTTVFREHSELDNVDYVWLERQTRRLCHALHIETYKTELLLGIFKQGPTPPLCSEKGATVFCHRAIQWFHRNCLIFFIWKINQIKPNFDKRMTIMTDCFKIRVLARNFKTCVRDSLLGIIWRP